MNINWPTGKADFPLQLWATCNADSVKWEKGKALWRV